MVARRETLGRVCLKRPDTCTDLEVHPKDRIFTNLFAMLDGKLAKACSEAVHLCFERLELGERDLRGERLERCRLSLAGLEGGDADRAAPAGQKEEAGRVLRTG